MIPRPPRSTLTNTPFPYTTLFRTRGGDTRQYTRLHRLDADRAHRVDLFVQLHRADLRRESRSRAARDHDRGHQEAQFADRGAADEIDREHLQPELAELHRALLGDDDADQKAHQPDDRQRIDSDGLKAADDRVPANAEIGRAHV